MGQQFQCREGIRAPARPWLRQDSHGIRFAPHHRRSRTSFVSLRQTGGDVAEGRVMTAQDNGGDKGEPRKLRVLVADDSSDAADSLALLVKTWGHDARAVYDGRAVLETAQAYLPDVALLDLGLPGVDGYQLALQFRRASALQDVVLFAVTGYDWKNAQIRSKEYGFEEHLLKPVDPARLRSLLDAPKQRLATQGGGQ